MIKVSREILMHPDFACNLEAKLCEMLESLMDSMFESGDEIDFDFIDECAEAVNAIRSGDTAQILPVISRKDFFRKLNIKTDKKFRIAAVSAAVAVLLFAAGTQIKSEENVSVIEALSGIISEIFYSEHNEEKINENAETSSVDVPEETAAVKGISIETTPDFKTEYFVGEKFSSEGLKVFAELENGEIKQVQSGEYSAVVSESFGSIAKYETVTIRFNGFTESLTVRIIENISTKKLNSIYAVFPDDFDFTSEDLENFKCDKMQVFALYSDGSERKLKNNEYTVSYELQKTFFDEKLNITVEFENCFCIFAVSKK